MKKLIAALVAVLMVMASEHYTEDDYIRDYEAYLNEAVPYFKKTRGDQR